MPHPPLASLLRQAFNSFLDGKQTNELPPQPLGFSESEIAYIGMLGTAANAVGACARRVKAAPALSDGRAP